MAPLPRELRRLLENVIVAARDAAEDAARAALRALSVDRSEPHPGISDEDRALRVALRARARQVGDFDLLVAEVAYEQWHRMLFARFLAENGLLMHPTGVAVTLAECAELAGGEGEPDEWMLAARYAAQMLPGIFRQDDPSVRVRFARNDTAKLEKLLTSLPGDAFTADDALGWVYQFWQSKKKKEVNASERKIGGADLPPVTQLFTEDYMVAFLLENTLGAWWAGRHPASPLLDEWQYLRLVDGAPAVGAFENWPRSAALITVMDPCCGSGHFLVAAFEMLRRMREEEEGIAPLDAADAVLRDNLFGLELDGRCVQIAVFALAVAAWKVGGYRELPAMNVACSGTPARGTSEEWQALGRGDERLADALLRMSQLFRNADTLGSLIDPRAAAQRDSLFGIDYDEVAPHLHKALRRFGGSDPAQQVLAQAAEDVAAAAKLLAGRYTLIATNPPYLGRGKQSEELRAAIDAIWPLGNNDLAITFVSRARAMGAEASSLAIVVPESWMIQAVYKQFRERVLTSSTVRLVALLGEEGFECFGIRGPRVSLTVFDSAEPSSGSQAVMIDAYTPAGQVLPPEKIRRLKGAELELVPQSGHRFGGDADVELLSRVATSTEGLSTGDGPRYERAFWEMAQLSADWSRLQTSPDSSGAISGCESVILWEQGRGTLASSPGARIQGLQLAGCDGVLVGRMRYIRATRYLGGHFDKACVVVHPRSAEDMAAVYTFCTSPDYETEVRRVAGTVSVATSTMVTVPFDPEHWSEVAAERYPNGLPEPRSDDPTQWLFRGGIVGSNSPLHVAVARLLGYSWPDQPNGEIERLVDSDGIVCLPPVAGERAAADRLRDVLAEAYGPAWSESVLDGLLGAEGCSDVAEWLRDAFFASHSRLFLNRPFIWHVWDGRMDGFSALLNYHKLDKPTLEKLTYSTLQWWIDRQRAEAGSGVSGAETRLSAALELQGRLSGIIEGEAPYDIYVRWKPLAKQPVGWDPDLNDGVRLNIRPFVNAGVLRSKFTVNWNKDRGKNPDGSERLNDLHFTIAEKLAARGER